MLCMVSEFLKIENRALNIEDFIVGKESIHYSTFTTYVGGAGAW